MALDQHYTKWTVNDWLEHFASHPEELAAAPAQLRRDIDAVLRARAADRDTPPHVYATFVAALINAQALSLRRQRLHGRPARQLDYATPMDWAHELLPDPDQRAFEKWTASPPEPSQRSITRSQTLRNQTGES